MKNVNGKGSQNSRMLVIYEFKKSGVFSLRPTKSGSVINRVLGLKPQSKPHRLRKRITDAELGRWVRMQLEKCNY
ncbi:MAG: hypothetical protein HY840_16025 [Bacteroidetes bacterium]|nr:hypothetical protein [Bacteroidota bacterium]